MSQAQFPIGHIERPPNNGAVVSVEQVRKSIGGVTTVTQALTKSQNVDQCVVFVSMRPAGSSDSRLGYRLARCDVYDNAGTPTLRVTKQATAYTVEVVATVVEFVTNVRIQKITWSTPSSTSTSWTASIPTAVDQSKAFLLTSYQNLNTGSYKAAEAYAVRARFTDDDEITFSRENTPVHGMGGFTWVVEDISSSNKYFSVQQRNISYASSTQTDDTLGSTVDVDKAMLIGSHSDPDPSYYGHWACITSELTDGDTLRIKRTTSNTGGNATIFVVEWQNETNIYHYSHTWTYGQTGAEATELDAIATTVDAGGSMAIGTMPGMVTDNVMRPDPYIEFGYATECQWPSIELDADGEGVTFRHWEHSGNTTSADVFAEYQIVEFEIA